MTKLVYLASCQRKPDGEVGTAILIAALATMNIRAEVVVWNDTTVDWAKPDLIAVRSTWDYQDHLSAFLAWADSIPAAKLLHGSNVFEWNTNKKYLLELADRRVPVIPTEYVEHIDDLRRIVKARARSVVKPAVGGSGKGVQLVTRCEDDWYPLAPGPWVVQPFLESIHTHGETNVFIIDGRITAQMVQNNNGQDLRIHHAYGGRAVATEVDFDAARTALRAYSATKAILGKAELSYARIDMLYHEGRLVVGEVEITEPSLGFGMFPQNVSAFATMLRRKLMDNERTYEKCSMRNRVRYVADDHVDVRSFGLLAANV